MRAHERDSDDQTGPPGEGRHDPTAEALSRAPRNAFGETTPADAAGWDEAMTATGAGPGEEPPIPGEAGETPIGDDPAAPGGHGEGP